MVTFKLNTCLWDYETPRERNFIAFFKKLTFFKFLLCSIFFYFISEHQKIQKKLPSLDLK